MLGAGDGLAELLVGMLRSLYGVRRVAANAAWQDICEAHRAVVIRCHPASGIVEGRLRFALQAAMIQASGRNDLD